jgi:hypothetical protein
LVFPRCCYGRNCQTDLRRHTKTTIVELLCAQHYAAQPLVVRLTPPLHSLYLIAPFQVTPFHQLPISYPYTRHAPAAQQLPT